MVNIAFLTILSFINLTCGKVVPYSGHVTVVHNGNSFQTRLVRNIIGHNVETIEHVLPKNSRFCSNLNIGSGNGLIVLMNDNALDICTFSTARPIIQVATSGSEAIVSVRSKSRSLQQRIRYDEKIIESILKGFFFDELVDNYLAGGNVDLESIKASNSFLSFSIPSWLSFLIGIGTSAYFYLKFLKKDAITPKEELKLIRTDVEYRDKARPKLDRNSLFPASSDDFRRWMKLITEVSVDYYEHPDVYNVSSDVKPGFLYSKMPKIAPENPESIETVLRDVYDKIFPGLLHFQHPRFHSYYPIGTSYPDVVGESLTSILGTLAFSWDGSPSIAELEMLIINWVGRAIGLPESFLFSDNPSISGGGGVLQSGASDSIFNAVNTAKYRAIESRITEKDLDKREKHDKACDILKKLVAYSSSEAHSSIEKACKVALVKLVPIDPKGDHFSLRGYQLEAEIIKDIERGYIPFFVHCSLGTTNTCAFDNLREITQVAKKYNLWVHIDAAYAGSFFICPEFRYLMDGIEDADSIDINMQKHLICAPSASFFWTKHKDWHQRALTVNPVYLKEHDGAIDFRNWTLLLSKRPHAIKIWFLLKLYGIKNLQGFIRRMIKCAKRMHNYVAEDQRFEIVGKPILGLVAFKVRHSDAETSSKMTRELIEFANRSRKIALTRAKPGGIDVIRISVNFSRTTDEEIDKSWNIFRDLADEYFLLSSGPKTFRTQMELENGIVTSPAVQTQATISAHSSATSLDITNNNNVYHRSPTTQSI